MLSMKLSTQGEISNMILGVAIQQPDTIEDFKRNHWTSLMGIGLPEEKRVCHHDPWSLGHASIHYEEDEDSSKGKNVRDMTKQQGVRSYSDGNAEGKASIPMIVCAHSYTDIMTYGSPQKMSSGGGRICSLYYLCFIQDERSGRNNRGQKEKSKNTMATS